LATDNAIVDPFGPVAITVSPPIVTVDVGAVGGVVVVVVDDVVVDVADVVVGGDEGGSTKQPVAAIDTTAPTPIRDAHRVLRFVLSGRRVGTSP